MVTVTFAAACYTLVFKMPLFNLKVCKVVIFAAGAGRYSNLGKYTECCWTIIGTDQFRFGDITNLYIGSAGAREEVKKAQIETLYVGEDVTRKVVDALKA